ncbi:tyrosine-type recombinase/integrase [Leptotrichia trevisanii]
MGIYKDTERGTWFVQLWYKDIFGNNRKKKKRGFKRQSDAKKWEVEFINSLSLTSDITFGNLYKEFIADFKVRARTSTVETRKLIVYKHILPFFENFKIRDITPKIIREWQNMLLNQNYSLNYLRTISQLLSSIFKYAEKFYNLKNNPYKISGPIGSTERKKEFNIWTEEDFSIFIKDIKEPVFSIAFKILFLCGLRVGELLALTFEDINFETNEIDINKTISRDITGTTVAPPKTKNSIRTIYCPEDLVKEIENYKTSFYEFDEKERLFPFSYDALRRRLVSISKKCDLKQIRIHDFRHSHASYLLYKKVDIAAVSKRLGHKNIKVTLETYAHLIPKSNDYLQEVLDDICF